MIATTTGLEMVEATAAARAKGQESVAFYDNLHGQTTEDHKDILQSKAKCARHLLPTGVTAEIQLIDDGLGYAVKREMGYGLDQELMDDDFLNKWTGACGFSASEKRIKITHLAADAWERVCARFDFEKAATRIGMRMTIDGTGDDEIKLQGVNPILTPLYTFITLHYTLQVWTITHSRMPMVGHPHKMWKKMAWTLMRLRFLMLMEH
jgi:hypothetical protein